MTDAVGIIFDFDGIIVDSEELQYRSYAAVLADLGAEVSRQEYEREWISAGLGPEYAVRQYGLDIAPDELRKIKEPVYRKMLQAEARLMPGAARGIERISAEMPIAVATNSMAGDVDLVLDPFDLRKYFAAVVTREDYEGRKPRPDAFLVAAQRLGLPPTRCVVIEDATKGVVAAERAGCPCIAIPHDFTRSNDFSRATTMVDSLDDVTATLVRQLVEENRLGGGSS